MSEQLKQISQNRNPTGIQDYPEEAKAEIMSYIFKRIENGMSLFQALKDEFDDKKTVIGISTFYKWKNDNMSWSKEYLRVCEVRHDILAESTLLIASTQLLATKVVDSEKGTFTTTYDNVERSKLMVGSIQWYLGKLAPDKYGNKAGEGQAEHVEQPLFDDID